jgi:steroid delta-isomerase-like uncharacterized protein
LCAGIRLDPIDKEAAMITLTTQSYANTSSEPSAYFLGVPTIVRATAQTTNGAFGLVEHLAIPPGFASPYHTHRLEDEAFYVLEGELAFVNAGRWTVAPAGTYVFGARNVPHGFKVIGDAPARMLLISSPGGFEQFIMELSEAAPALPDMARLLAAAARYQIDIHGPLPAAPDGLAGAAARSVDLKRLNDRWIQAFNERDWETERAIRTPDFQAYLSGAPEPLDAAAWSAFLVAFTKAFPDSRITVAASISEGDMVATRWSLTGTHRGEFQGIAPTGRTISFSGIEYNRVVNSRFVEHWSMFDQAALLRQIGAMPA